MKLDQRWLILIIAGIAAASVPLAMAQDAKEHAMHSGNVAGDARQLVKFPEPMRLHTLSNMRYHLLALQDIHAALSQAAYDKAAQVAEQRLGMSSLDAHGAAHLAPFMPQAMQNMGTAMHRAASRFAVEAQNASASNDLRPVLAALAGVMQQCVACHAVYRMN